MNYEDDPEKWTVVEEWEVNGQKCELRSAGYKHIGGFVNGELINDEMTDIWSHIISDVESRANKLK